MLTTIRYPLITLLIISALNACGVTEYAQQHYEEAWRSYPAPERLEGDTAETGLLLVDAVGKKALNTMALSGAVIAAVDSPQSEILAGSFRQGGLLKRQSGVVVFEPLPPGRYRLLRIKTENANAWETVVLPGEPAYEIDIRPGGLTYLGQIEVRHPMGTTSRVFTLIANPQRETEAWQLLLEHYADSPWAAIVAGRLAES